jgi:hypothetical protein
VAKKTPLVMSSATRQGVDEVLRALFKVIAAEDDSAAAPDRALA